MSSTQSTVMGTLAPHLFQSADIPHLTAIIPVRLEFGVMTLGFASTIRASLAFALTNNSEQKPLKNWCLKDVVDVAVSVIVTVELIVRTRRREMRPLDKANMVEVKILTNQISRRKGRFVFSDVPSFPKRL